MRYYTPTVSWLFVLDVRPLLSVVTELSTLIVFDDIMGVDFFLFEIGRLETCPDNGYDGGERFIFAKFVQERLKHKWVSKKTRSVSEESRQNRVDFYNNFNQK